ncbi:MAG: hypothetical protein K2H20_02690 [Bacilli bacterium]|nr:hypothetical protein [Bacilli bacterium]
MGCVRVNKEELNSVRSTAEELVDILKAASEHANSLREDAVNNSAKWGSNPSIVEVWKNYVKEHRHGDRKLGEYVIITDPEGEEINREWKWDENAVESEAKRKIAAAKTSYDSHAKYLFSPGDSKNDANEVLTSLTEIIIAIEDFEGISPNLEEALKTIEANLPEGFSVKNMDIAIDGEVVNDVQVLVFTDKEGNIVTNSELVNAFYTYTGTTVASNIAADIYFGDVSKEKREEILKIIGEKTKKDVKAQTSKGMFSVVSDTGISGVYEAAMGEKYDYDEVHNKYMASVAGLEPDEIGKELGEQTNSDRIVAMGMAGLVAAALNSDPSELYDLPIDTDKLKDEEKDKESQEGNKQFNNDVAKQIVKIEQLGENEITPVGGSELPPEEGFVEVLEEGGVEPTPPPGPEDSLKISDELAQKIDDQIKRNEEIVTPEEMTQPEITSTDVDDQVRDEFYSKLTESDKLAEERAKYVEDYVNMTDEDKVKALEGLGYTGVVAAGLVADRATGQTAYILGIENQKMAEMSNNLAIQQGFMNHDTRFDDPVGMDYFNSGQANVDLTPISQDVQVARTNLTDAKTQYDASVTNANKAISDANVSKEKYNNVLNNIRSKNGTDPKNWTEEQVKEYNEAAREYNSAVDKANNAVKEVDAKKDNYAKQKEQYNVAYEKYREEAEKALQQTIENNDVPQDTFTDIGEPPTAPGDPIDTSISGGNLNIGGGTSPEEDQNQSNNNNGDPIPNTEGVVYE